MLARVIAIVTCLSVRPSVYPSRVGIVSKRRRLASWTSSWWASSLSGSLTILVFWCQISSQNSKRFPEGASKKRGVGKFCDFLALSVNISKTVADRAKVAINWLIWSRTWAFDWHQDRWPWMTMNCCKVKLVEFRDISRVSEAITAKRMKIDPCCQRRNCSPSNALLSDVQVTLISQGVHPLWGVKQGRGG